MTDLDPNQKASDSFGELLMSQVRDSQIQLWDETLAGRARHSNYRKVYEGLGQSLDAEQLRAVRDLIPYVVDNVIAQFLGVLEDEERVKIAVQVEGQPISSLYRPVDSLESALYGEDGWIARFSKNDFDPFGIEK